MRRRVQRLRKHSASSRVRRHIWPIRVPNEWHPERIGSTRISVLAYMTLGVHGTYDSPIAHLQWLDNVKEKLSGMRREYKPSSSVGGMVDVKRQVYSGYGRCKVRQNSRHANEQCLSRDFVESKSIFDSFL